MLEIVRVSAYRHVTHTLGMSFHGFLSFFEGCKVVVRYETRVNIPFS
jgi:hypothetical protein